MSELFQYLAPIVISCVLIATFGLILKFTERRKRP